MRIFFLFLLILLSYGFTSAQSTMLDDKEMQQVISIGLDKMYNLEFEEADKYFIKVKEKYPNHPAYDLLKSMSLTWDMMYNNSFKKRAKEGLTYLENSINLAGKLLEKNSSDPEGIFFTLAGRASLALYYSQVGETMKSVNEARKAYGLVKDANKLKEKMVDFYFPVGLYNYYVVQYPENHPVFKPFMIFFLKGDKQGGLNQLDICNKNGVYSKTEATFYLGHIYLRYEENPQIALKYTAPLVEKYPENIYFRINHCEALIGAGRYKEAEYLAYDLYQSGKPFARVASYTFYGLLNEKHFNNPEKARRYFQQAIDLARECEFPTQDFTGQCYAGLGRHYHAAGNKDKAVENYKKCKEITDYLSLMKEADEYLRKYD